MIAVQSPETRPANPAARASSRLAGTRLRNSCLLSGDEQDVLDAAVLPPIAVGANVDLVREGDRTDGLFIVLEGWACQYTTTRDGGRQLSALLVPGDVGNLDSLMFERPDYSLRTLSKARIAVLPRERALALAAQHPGIARTFTWLAMVENAVLGRWTLSLGRKPALDRLAHLLCELSVRVGAEDGGKSNFACPLTQEHFADALGLTSVHVNRTMQQLRLAGLLVTVDRVVTLPDLPALRRVGGFDPRYLHLDGAPQTLPAR